jgi:trk system potassium uptake protein TrkA
MHAVILGAGRVGLRLARQLIDENRDVAIVEKDPETARRVERLLDCLVINAEGTSLATLEQAGIRKADYFVAVTDTDEVNMIACGIVSSEYDVPYKIARSRDVEFDTLQVLSRPFLGIDYVVNPEAETSHAIVQAIERGALSDVVFFEKSGLQMRSLTVEPQSVFDGRSIRYLQQRIQATFLVAVIIRDGEVMIPRGDSVIRENDRVYLIATEDGFERIFSHAGKLQRKAHRVVLIGSSRIGRHAIRELLGSRERSTLRRFFARFTRPTAGRITIIDNDYEECRELSEEFQDAMVINADISDEHFAEEELLAEADVVVATSGNQELNIVNAVYAKTLGANRTVCLVNKASYIHVAASLGLDVAISPVESMVNSILKHMRRGNVRSVTSIAGGDVEVLELVIEEASPAVGSTIGELGMPRQALILTVSRDGQEIIPGGDVGLETGDGLIVIARREAISKVEELFAT